MQRVILWGILTATIWGVYTLGWGTASIAVGAAGVTAYVFVTFVYLVVGGLRDVAKARSLAQTGEWYARLGMWEDAQECLTESQELFAPYKRKEK